MKLCSEQCLAPCHGNPRTSSRLKGPDMAYQVVSTSRQVYELLLAGYVAKISMQMKPFPRQNCISPRRQFPYLVQLVDFGQANLFRHAGHSLNAYGLTIFIISCKEHDFNSTKPSISRFGESNRMVARRGLLESLRSS